MVLTTIKGEERFPRLVGSVTEERAIGRLITASSVFPLSFTSSDLHSHSALATPAFLEGPAA